MQEEEEELDVKLMEQLLLFVVFPSPALCTQLLVCSSTSDRGGSFSFLMSEKQFGRCSRAWRYTTIRSPLREQREGL